MAKKRKRTPEDEAYLRFCKESDARLRRLRELVDKGMKELEARRAEQRSAESS
jgi:hypothetical protein